MEIDGKVELRFLRAHGFRNIQNVVQKLKRKMKFNYDFVEIMACPSGKCWGGVVVLGRVCFRWVFARGLGVLWAWFGFCVLGVVWVCSSCRGYGRGLSFRCVVWACPLGACCGRGLGVSFRCVVWACPPADCCGCHPLRMYYRRSLIVSFRLCMC